MIKVKDGYGKLIGTTYQGSATQVLLSNGGNLEFSSGTKANTLVLRNASLHIYATYFNSAISDEALTDIGSVYVRNTSDTFIRRISKTQFYSIIDNKFVTLDTALTITGVKTFSTGPILANNATITLNLNSTSNYTTVIKWLKGGTSLGTYNPSIGLHNTGGDGTGSICILPYPTETSPWNGTVGLFISKGVLRLDGKAVAIAENYYTKTESDNRYVNVTGDTMTGPLIVKASITGTLLISNIANGTAPLKVTSKTVVTNLNSDLLDGYHETSFFRARGSLTIAGSIPTTTELSSNNNLSGNWNVSFPGASGHLVQFNTGSGSTRYMQFYSHYSGSLYWRNSTYSTLSTKSWKTIVDSANYTGIVLKIGTATKGSATLPIYLNAGTPTACSTTLGVSITGNAATATKLLTARTINGTSFNGTTNITTAYWGATRTITLSGAVTGSASVNGSLNVTITTTYQTGSIDGRYVGGKKTAGHGSQGTAYTADTYSSNFVNKAFVAYAERGSWAYANNGYITTNTGVNIPLAGTAIFQWGASDTNKTLLFITPHNNSGVSNPATNEMLFYTSNGSGYISAWTRVLTHRNYTTYTVTKTGGGASGTWGISITGNANTATRLNSRGRLTALSGTNAGEIGLSMYEAYSNGYPSTYGNLIHLGGSSAAGRGELLLGWAGSNGGYASVYYRNKRDVSTANWSSWVTLLDSSNYTSFTNANYVQSLGTNGNYVTWTKNNTVNNLTVPYAVHATYLDSNDTRNVNTTPNKFSSGARFEFKSNSIDGLSNGGSYHGILHFKPYGGTTDFSGGLTHLLGFTDSGNLYMRTSTSSTAWGSWKLILNLNTADGRYVTLTTNQTVSGIKTFSRQLKFTVATGTSPFTVSSTTVVSNLNADTVDGLHASAFSYKSWWHWSGQSGQPSWLWGGNSENNYYVYNPSNFNVNSAAYIRSRGTRAPQTGRTLSLGDVYSYRTSSGSSSTGAPTTYTAVIGFGLGTSGTVEIAGGWTSGMGLWYRALRDTTDNWYGWRKLIDTSNITNYYWANIKISSSSSTSTSPTFSTAYTSNWFRSNGQTGWYSLTYGGGWYMTDSTWIRTYGSKSVYQNTGLIRTDGYLVTNGGITIGATSPNNGTYKLYCNGLSYHRGDSYYTAAIRLNNRGNNSIYCGPNDAANTIGGALNNLVFSSWYGVSFTTSCSGLTCTNKNAVSINCRTGLLNAYLVYANGFHHRSKDSNNYVLLAGGSYKNLADFAKGNAGASNRGVYVTSGTVKAMTYYLNATINSGSSGKLAYYSGTNSIDDYTSTKGSSSTPIYLNAGVPTACTGVMVKYWAIYTINNYDGPSVTYSKRAGNYNFVISSSKRDTGRYTIGTVYPSGLTWYTTLVWAVGALNLALSDKSSNSLLYCTLIRGYLSGSRYYWYINTADDSSANNGSFDLFFLCF